VSNFRSICDAEIIIMLAVKMYDHMAANGE